MVWLGSEMSSMYSISCFDGDCGKVISAFINCLFKFILRNNFQMPGNTQSYKNSFVYQMYLQANHGS